MKTKRKTALKNKVKKKYQAYVRGKKGKGRRFVRCPNTAWHHLGSTCKVCGLKD